MFRWQKLNVRRLYGLDLKTNVVDVKDGYSLDCSNVIQNAHGVISKRPGNSIMFAADESASTIEVNELGRAKIGSTNYYFKFSDGKFSYATSLTGAVTVLSPSPAISTTNKIWWATIDNRIYFVDGDNVLRYFTGTAIREPVIYSRPTVAPTSTSGAGTFTYLYTVDKESETPSVGYGESTASPVLSSIVSAATIRVPENTGPQTLVAGDIVRIYSRSDTVAAGSKLVATHVWTAANDTAGFADIVTVAISDTQAQLYTELGLAGNTTAPAALVGLVEHYGRLVAWKADTVLNAKVTNANSWPINSAVSGETFQQEFAGGDGEGVQRCISFQESLYVMKKTKIAIFGGLGPDDTGANPYTFRRLETNGIGCVAPKSVAIIGEDDGQNYIIFLSGTGFYGTNGAKPIRLGENIETEIAPFGESTLSTATAIYHRREGYYLCVVGAQGNRKAYTYDTRKDKGDQVGWFRWEDLDFECIYFDEFENRYFFGGRGFAGIERNAGLSADFSDIRIEFVAAASVNTGTDEITVVNSYQTGDQVVIRTSGTIPAGLVANTTYFVIRISATQIQLATTLANAQAGTEINITTAGAGVHTIVGSQAISAYYTTNWMAFGAPDQVKKLGKPAIVLNAKASSVSVVMESAYDWANSFSDTRTIAFTPTHIWGGGLWGGGSFTVWGGTEAATPKNAAISRRKARAVRYRFTQSVINQDMDIQGIIQPFAMLRNRGNFGDL